MFLGAMASCALADADPGASRVPLYWLWNEGQTDSAYTISAERRDRMIREQGYVDMGPIGYVETQPARYSRPLVCFYAATPRTDSYCTASPLEQRLARSLGFEDVGVEGFLPRERVVGTVVLYRVTRALGNADKDREHRFVVSDAELVRLRKEGWAYDGSKGFIFSSP
jgi:hypothetical protein